VALSPTVFFMASVVNDSGFEIAAAFAAWCGGVALATHDRAPRALVYWTALALGLLLLARPLSLVNSAVLVVSLALLAGRHRLQALLGRSDVRHAMVALCIPLAIALAWLAVSGLPTLLGSPLKPQLTMVGSVEYSLRLVNQRLFQCIGDFGWLDTPSPLVTTVLWITAVGALTVAGLALSKACRRSLCFLIPAILAVNLVVEAPRLNALGPFWQGRYWLPIVMGVPLVAASLGHSRAHGRVRRPVVGAIATLAAGSVLAVGQIAAFLTALHRYETGLGARPGTPLRWVPPGGTVLVVTLMVTGTALLVAFATRYALATGSPPRSDAPGGPDPGSRHRGQAALAEA
jgi:hypothetical protein